jgi:membrane dipeptidase
MDAVRLQGSVPISAEAGGEFSPVRPNDLHKSAIVIDGVIASRWSRAVFESMHRAGITAANCTTSVWEGFEPSIRALAQWKIWFREHCDILLQVCSVADIKRAKEANKVGIIIGWQNSTGFGEDLRYVPIFAELGLRIVQLTYNTANMAGSGCLESRDGGLTDFGRDLVAALNREHILIDLSHVGSRTSREAIETSMQPVAYTHCAPRALKDHPRNKTDEEFRFIADHGGLVCVNIFPPFTRHGNESTLDDFLDAVEHVVNICGTDHVGIATDFCEDETPERMVFYTRDKGYGRQLGTFEGMVRPAEFERIDQYPNLTAAMERRKWSELRIRKLLGENWLRLLHDVWR